MVSYVTSVTQFSTPHHRQAELEGVLRGGLVSNLDDVPNLSG
jgi:hypothetical protein